MITLKYFFKLSTELLNNLDLFFKLVFILVLMSTQWAVEETVGWVPDIALWFKSKKFVK